MNKTILFYVLCACFLSVGFTGCAQKTNTVVPQVPSHSQNIQSLKNNQIITLDGVITKVGPASGKSMAAWNGFDVGEMVYRFEPSPTESINAQSIRLHVPERLVVFVYLNRVIRLTAQVHVPTPVQYDPVQPMQMPTSTSGAAIARETTLTAVDVAEVESK